MLKVGFITDTGARRSKNEDSVLVSWRSDEGSPPLLVAIADGMGGLADGDIASRTATATLGQAFTRDASSEALREAFATADAEIRARSRRGSSHEAMGSTLVACLVDNGSAYLANVGDSRGYVLRGRDIVQITKDHSLVEEQLCAGLITAGEAELSPYRHVLTRALGIGGSPVNVDVFGPITMTRGVAIILCSDGLYSHVQDSEIAQVVTQSDPLESALKLVRLANERGGTDNITVVVVRSE